MTLDIFIGGRIMRAIILGSAYAQMPLRVISAEVSAQYLRYRPIYKEVARKIHRPVPQCRRIAVAFLL